MSGWPEGHSTAWIQGGEWGPSPGAVDEGSLPGLFVTRSVLGARYLLNACQTYSNLSDCLSPHHCSLLDYSVEKNVHILETIIKSDPVNATKRVEDGSYFASKAFTRSSPMAKNGSPPDESSERSSES